MNEPDLRHAIRHAIPKLSAIADDIAGFSTTQLERADAAEELFSVVADLLSALDGSEGASGPTTAQEGQEGRSGQMSGVSGEALDNWRRYVRLGEPEHADELIDAIERGDFVTRDDLRARLADATSALPIHQPHCPDCGVPVGEEHDALCDVARCLVTGGQRLMCDEDHDHGRDGWTGQWPDLKGDRT